MMKRLQKWSNPFQALITTTPDGNIYMRRFILLETPLDADLCPQSL